MLKSLRTATLAHRGFLAIVLASLLAACGGSSSQLDPFKPERLLVFGDELSLLTAEGKKYSTNEETEDDGLLCESQPLWVQYLASYFGMVFAECNPDDVAAPAGEMLATLGATVDDFVAQTQAFDALSGYSDTDLITVMVGQNDVLQAYASYPGETESALLDRVAQAGEKLASRINALTDLGPRVLVSTIPDVGLSPFALAEKAAHDDIDRSALLQRLVRSFNTALRLNLLNDGTKIGLMLADDLSRSAVRFPEAYGLSNVTEAVCTADLPDCTSLTLVEDGEATTYFWADDTRPTTVLQQRLGAQAVSRLQNLPF